MQGDAIEQAIEARRMLTRGKMNQRDKIRFAELCQAVDFKRGKRVNLERGEITQQSFDRMNMMLDEANVGHEVDSETTLRSQFNEAEEIVYYTSYAI